MASAMTMLSDRLTPEDWEDEDGLLLLRSWAQDGCTQQDIAARMGISSQRLKSWRKKHPLINNALMQGRELVDYKVESALLKSALGYKKTEVRVTTIMRHGKLVETQKEVFKTEQPPSVQAIQVWLYNRCPDKWRKDAGKITLDDMEDSSIKIEVTRASKRDEADTEDKDWQDSVNQSVTVRKATKEEKAEAEKEKKKAKEEEANRLNTTVEEEDLDYWPEDWEDELDEDQ